MDQRVLKIAIQTVLYKNKTRLFGLVEEDDALLDEMSRDIAAKAAALERITDAVVHELDTLHQHEVQFADGQR